MKLLENIQSVTLIVQDRVTVDPVDPRLNPRSLHMSEASTYTERYDIM